MPILLALLWGLPLLYLPQFGGRWSSFFVPRATYLVYLTAALPLLWLRPFWRRGWWTWTEWALVAAALAQTARVWSPTGTGRGAVWLAGFVVLRMARGLREGDRAFLRRWWWPAVALGVLVAIQEYWAPGLRPWTLGHLHAWRPTWFPVAITTDNPGSGTYGNPLWSSEAALLLLDGPTAAMGLAVLTPLLLASRGPLLAAAVAGFCTRWGALALGVLPLAALGLWWHGIPWGASMTVRWQIWGRTWQLIMAHPLLGVGTGMYRFAVRQGGLIEWASWIGNAHNEYLERMAEWGIPAGLLFLAWVTAMAQGSWGRTAVALTALVQFPFAHPATWPLWCLLAGCDLGRAGCPDPLARLATILRAGSAFRRRRLVPAESE